MKEIPIRCKGNRYIDWQELRAFQGNLKDMTTENYKRLRSNILKHGFIAPVFVWNRREILDGHGRLLVLKELIKEGYTIGKIPVVDIEAETKKEAAEILLSINSHYQTITDEGLYEFLNTYEIDISELDLYNLPDIDLHMFEQSFKENKHIIEDEEKEIFNIAFSCTKEQYQILKEQLKLRDNVNIYPAEVLIERLSMQT